jgi:alpha-galactosidase
MLKRLCGLLVAVLMLTAGRHCLAQDQAPVVLTPAAPDEPRIVGAKVVGVRPGHPVLFVIPATGMRPMSFAAQGLPKGLNLDPDTGWITGSIAQAGQYVVEVTATNPLGSATRKLRFVVGPTIALTPPMGWNSWNCFGRRVTGADMRAAADAMVSSGLIEHGWSYVNVDDCWQVPATQPSNLRRGPDGVIRANAKFGDMKAMADFIHADGLHAGLYSSPGPSTCAGFTASYQNEERDAQTYAAWGYDYLKYDWCSYSRIYNQIHAKQPAIPIVQLRQAPYALMGSLLVKQDRDIIFSLCQYGNANVSQWGAKVDGNSWRTTGDINDTWAKMSRIGFGQAGLEKYAEPGHWNDPDMLEVGIVRGKPTRLTPDEQYTHISLWCLLSAPLLIGCDLTKLDAFTMGLLSNDEVLAVDQDSLGQQASRIHSEPSGAEVWAKELEDGTKAVGLFNRGDSPATVTVSWEELGVNGQRSVRDLWRQKFLGNFDEQFSTQVAKHGVVLVRVGPPDDSGWVDDPLGK